MQFCYKRELTNKTMSGDGYKAKFAFCVVFMIGEITIYFCAHRNDVVEMGNVDDKRKKGNIDGMLSLSKQEKLRLAAHMEGLVIVGARVGRPSYQEKAEYMDRDTEAGGWG